MKQTTLTQFLKSDHHDKDSDESDTDEYESESASSEENKQEESYWSRIKTRTLDHNKRCAVYSIVDDLSANSTALRKMTSNGANQ